MIETSMADKLNQAVEKRNNTITLEEVVEKNTSTLALNLNPSEFLPIRTARYWSDVEMGQLPDILFYKENKNGSYEVHRNATKNFSKVVDLSALHQVLKETAFELSLKGESDIAVFSDNNTIAPLKITLIRKHYKPNGELYFYQGIVNFDTGTSPWILTKKFTYNDEGEVIMNNIPYQNTPSKDNDMIANWKEMSIETFNETFKQEMIAEVNLGKINFPVITLTNTGADRWGSGTSDTAEVQDILKRLDEVENAIDRTVKTSKTRLYNKRKNGSMSLGLNDDKTTNTIAQQITDDVELVNITEDPHVDGDSLQISDRQLQANQWYEIRTKLLQEYFSHTGENVAADAHGNNQHTYEVQSKGDNKYRRATAKRVQRQMEIISLVEIIISAASKLINNPNFVGLDKISVNINETDIRKEYEIEDKVEKLLNLGLISKVQALMKVEGIDEITAQNLLEAKERHDKLNNNDDEIKLPAPQDPEPIEPIEVKGEPDGD